MTVTAQAILSTIAAEAGLDEEALKPDATLEELDISSLDLASAVFALEDNFGIEVEPSDIDRSFTVSRLIDHVMSLADK
ncbi:MAG: acyl carrier protein [Novosphingobium sp.]|nr:acyl carrier protein [Novosphingobium sp.]